MADLGEFGRALAIVDQQEGADPDTFGFHGHRFTVPAGLSPLPMLRFAWRQKTGQLAEDQAKARRDRAQQALAGAVSEAARAVHQQELLAAEQDVVDASVNQMAAMYEFMAGCIPDPAEWQQFQQVAMDHGVQADELMEVCSAVFAAAVGRPTSRPSESSDGPSTTGAASTVSYASPEPTSGQPPRPTDSPDTAPISFPEPTPLQLQRAQMFGETVPVGQLLAAGG